MRCVKYVNEHWKFEEQKSHNTVRFEPDLRIIMTGCFPYSLLNLILPWPRLIQNKDRISAFLEC